MPMIKAIETSYRGYKFRSRLEARWAVFFTALGLDWAYEIEGYDLGDAGWYLPDFWITKRVAVSKDDLCGRGQSLPIDPAYGHPPVIGIWVEIKPSTPSSTELGKLIALARSTQHTACLLAGQIGDEAYDTYRVSPPYIKVNRCGASAFEEIIDWVGLWGDAVSYKEAFTEACSARFEHEETPQNPLIRIRTLLAQKDMWLRLKDHTTLVLGPTSAVSRNPELLQLVKTHKQALIHMLQTSGKGAHHA